VARLIVKSPYIKGGNKGGGARGHLKYISVRDDMELLPSGYMEYMAERPWPHSLFSDKNDVDLKAVIKHKRLIPLFVIGRLY